MSEQASGTGDEIIDDLAARGLIHDHTDLELLRTRLREGVVTIYAGFDPTADSLHVGNLVPLLLLRRFQLFGHRPIALAGGATGMIGDPGGRSEERNLLDSTALDHNLAAIRPQLASVLDFDEGPLQAELVDNRSWTEPVTVLEFLRDVGKHVTVNQMLAKESVKARVESEHGISFTEFSYMLLQANDYWWLHQHKGCELQVGGSDQWGNITAGVDLIRRKEAAHVHALTVPLITSSDGRKFGKSAGADVWLSPDRTSPYEFFQYWMNVEDQDVERWLLQLTLLPVPRVAAVMQEHRAVPEKRDAQRVLARELTTVVHGASIASDAESASSDFTRAADDRTADELAALVDEIPTTRVDRARLDAGIDVVDLLVESGLAKSKGEARRTLEQRGIYVNDAQLEGAITLSSGSLLHDRYLMLRSGKKRRHLVVVDS